MFDEPLRLSVPWPPTANHSHITLKTGRRIPSKDTREYWTAVEQLVGEAASGPWEGGLLVVQATYYKPDARRRDTDNVRKILADGVARGLGTDDCWFLWQDQDIAIDRKDPRVELVIYPKGTDE